MARLSKIWTGRYAGRHGQFVFRLGPTRNVGAETSDKNVLGNFNTLLRAALAALRPGSQQVDAASDTRRSESLSWTVGHADRLSAPCPGSSTPEKIRLDLPSNS